MSSDGVSVSVRGLGKDYRIGAAPTGDSFVQELWRRLQRRHSSSTLFTALEDVTFDVPMGQVLGIVGRNGAGKSTLLKILTRITPPTRGEATLLGRVGSLLEVGTGFHHELTGRENMYLNGAVLGMRKREVDARFDEIVDFAGVERFLDTPVKRYSSGMYVRLAFALAAHLDCDVLLVDEVLAVGDQEFQQRCVARMRDVATDGRTVLLVSHQLNTVAALCDRVVYLKHGALAGEGPTQETLEQYLRETASDGEARDLGDYTRRPGTGEVRMVRLEQESSEGPLRLRWTIRGLAGTETVYVSFHIVNELGVTLLQCDSRLVTADVRVHEGTEVEGSFTLHSPDLKPGSYQVDAFVCRPADLVDGVEGALRFEVSPILAYPRPAPPDATKSGLVLPRFDCAAGVARAR